jgi:hypothetical protein
MRTFALNGAGDALGEYRPPPQQLSTRELDVRPSVQALFRVRELCLIVQTRAETDRKAQLVASAPFY